MRVRPASRSPRRVIVLFLTLVLVPSALLVGVGWQLFQNDRQAAQRDLEERRRQLADVAVSLLDQRLQTAERLWRDPASLENVGSHGDAAGIVLTPAGTVVKGGAVAFLPSPSPGRAVPTERGRRQHYPAREHARLIKWVRPDPHSALPSGKPPEPASLRWRKCCSTASHSSGDDGRMPRVSSQAGFMTADELLRLPRGTWRYELVRGELRRMTPAGHVHGRTAARVGARLSVFVDEHGLGDAYAAETGFLLRRSPDTVRAPDAAFVSRERLARMTLQPEGYFPGPPDFAVEVLSPSDTDREVSAKIADWLECGCCAVLVLDPVERTAHLHRPNQEPALFTSREAVMVPDLLPGWSLDLGDLYR